VLVAAAVFAILEARRERVRISIDLLPRPGVRITRPVADRAFGLAAEAGADVPTAVSTDVPAGRSTAAR
jgi:hypothetical protein